MSVYPEIVKGVATGKYVAQVWFDKKRLARTFSSEKEARKNEPKVLRELVLRVGGPLVDITVEEYLNGYLESKVNSVADATYDHYVRDLNRLFEGLKHLELNKLRKKQLQDRLNQIHAEHNYSNNTYLGMRKSASAFFNKAVEDELISKKPMRGIELPVHREEATNEFGKNRVLEPEEIKKLEEVIKGDRFEVLFLLLNRTGMRIGEARALRWKNVDFKNRKITVLGTYNKYYYLDKYKNNPDARVLAPKTKRSI